MAPRRKWWLYITVGLAIRFFPPLYPSVPTWFVLATSLNDMLKGILAAYLLLHVRRGSFRLDTLRKFGLYLLIAVFLTPALSAFAGAAARGALGFAFWPAWNQWFIGDALANLVLTPTLLYSLSVRFRTIRTRILEILLWAISFSISLFCVVWFANSMYAPIALYAPIPFLIWAAVRLGPIGASSAVSLIALLSMFRTYVPLHFASENVSAHDVLFVQLFLAVATVPMLVVAILIEERGVVQTRLRNSQERLKEDYVRVRDLAGKLIGAHEVERKRIAFSLRDDIGQPLSLVPAKLEVFAQQFPQSMNADEVLAALQEDVVKSCDQLCELSHQVYAFSLHYLGLAHGLRSLCRSISEAHGIVAEVSAHEVPSLSPELNLCLFRVAQEALNNAVRHGQAKQVLVRVRHAAGSIQLEVWDDGIGFDAGAPSNGLGLVSMRERLRTVDGTLTVTSAPGQGTVVIAAIHIEQSMAKKAGQ